MTDVDDIDLRQLVADRLANTHPDVLRELLSTFIHTLMGAEADALCGAGSLIGRPDSQSSAPWGVAGSIVLSTLQRGNY